MANGLFGTLGRQWKIVALATAVTMAIALLVIALIPQRFRASASAIVVPGAAITEPTDVVRSLDTLERRSVIATLARIPAATQTLAATAARLKMDVRDVERHRISTTVIPQTNIIRIDVEGPQPLVAANIANATLDVTADAAARLFRIYDVRALERADVNVRGTGPGLMRSTFVALALGLLAGIVLGLLIDRWGVEWQERLRYRLPLRHV